MAQALACKEARALVSSCAYTCREHVAFVVKYPSISSTPQFRSIDCDVKAYVYTIVAPTIDYWKETIEGKKEAQLARIKTVRIFNPLHVLGNKISESVIVDGLKIFKFYCHLL